MSIQGKHIIVTGGGSGVGAKTAKALAKQGAKVTIMGRKETPLREQRLPYQLCDVTNEKNVEAAFDVARSEHGPIWGVIANAGAATSLPFKKMHQAHLQSMLAVNLIGVSNSFRAGLPDMLDANDGRMIAIASTAGLKGYAYASAYAAAKHGVVGLVRSLAIELASKGITVNAICPGYIETPLLDSAVENIIKKSSMNRAQVEKTLLKGNPQDRFIQADEVAEAVLWLCSNGARSVNGHTMALSGGEI